MLAASAFGPVTAATRTVALVSEMVHTATLLHDDVTDDGMERRGAATSRRLWGNAVSVLAGDLLLVHAISRTFTEVPAIVTGLLVTLREMVDGEVLQLRGRTELLVSESHYNQVARGKTASLFAWAARSGALTGGAPIQHAESLSRFGEKLGLAFQMVDDVLDFVGDSTGKTSLADLREGKVSLPLVYAVERCPEIKQDLLAIHNGDSAPIDRVAARVIKSGACDQVRSLAKVLTHEAVTALRSIGDSAPLRLLEGVASDLVARVG
jgi:octaprenyl-diphosphate synthase